MEKLFFPVYTEKSTVYLLLESVSTNNLKQHLVGVSLMVPSYYVLCKAPYVHPPQDFCWDGRMTYRLSGWSP